MVKKTGRFNVQILPVMEEAVIEERLDVSNLSSNSIDAPSMSDRPYSDLSTPDSCMSDEDDSLKQEDEDTDPPNESCCTRCCAKRDTKLHSVREYSIRALFSNMGRNTIIGRISAWGSIMTHQTEELFTNTSSRGDMYRGPTKLLELRRTLQRLENLFLFHQVSTTTFDMKQLMALRLSAMEDNDKDMMLNLRHYLLEVNRLESEYKQQVNSKAGWLGRVFGEQSGKRDSRSNKKIKLNLNIRRKLDKVLASEGVLKQIRLMLAGSVECSAFKVCINVIWLILCREDCQSCSCSDENICPKCAQTIKRFSEWVLGFQSMIGCDERNSLYLGDMLLEMLCSDFNGQHTSRDELITNPRVWVVITNVITYMPMQSQCEILGRVNWLLIHGDHNRSALCLGNDWYRGLLAIIPSHMENNPTLERIRALSLNVLSLLYSHMMITSEDFSESLHSALGFMLDLDKKVDDSKVDAKLKGKETSFSSEHHQHVARDILSSLLTRCKKLKSSFSPHNYDTLSWHNVLPLLNYIKSFIFETANWTASNQAEFTRARTFSKISYLSTVIDQEGTRICPLYKFSTQKGRLREISQKFGIKNSISMHQHADPEYGFHTSQIGELLDYELLQKAIALKRILLVNFDTSIQPRLSLSEKKFLAEWDDIYTLFCLCEKIMAEYKYRRAMASRLNPKAKSLLFIDSSSRKLRQSCVNVTVQKSLSSLQATQSDELKLRCIGRSKDPFSKTDIKLILSKLLPSRMEQRKELCDLINIH